MITNIIIEERVSVDTSSSIDLFDGSQWYVFGRVTWHWDFVFYGWVAIKPMGPCLVQEVPAVFFEKFAQLPRVLDVTAHRLNSPPICL